MTFPTLDIQYDRYSFILNGQRTCIRSGAMHYFRLPQVALWRDRLTKLKAAGYNTVDLYFCWGYHSPAPGEYDFTGFRDVDALLDIVESLGLYLIARPGPYINAEYTAGGLPGWLLVKEGVILRNRDEDGNLVMNAPYMESVREWWEHIVPKFANRPNLLMVQIENEYATADVEPDYMEILAQWTRELGVPERVPLMHNDMYAAGLYADVVDIYAFDHYPVTRFDVPWQERPESTFAVVDQIEDSLREFCEDRPLMVAELQAGWFGTWLGDSYERIIEGLGPHHLALITKSLLGQGLTVFNHYKAIGGTNWGTIGSTDTYTSYDFAAPISESGLYTERLYDAKCINLLLQSFALAATERVAAEAYPATVSDPDLLYRIRRQVGSAEKTQAIEPEANCLEGIPHWLFFRNFVAEPQQTQVTYAPAGLSASVHLAPYEMLILPVNVPLTPQLSLTQSTVEPLFYQKDVLVLKGNHPFQLDLASPAGKDEIQLELLQGHCETLIHPVVQAAFPVAGGSHTVLHVEGGALREDERISLRILVNGDPWFYIHVLGKRQCQTFWPIAQQDGLSHWVTGPELVLPAPAPSQNTTVRFGVSARTRHIQHFDAKGYLKHPLEVPLLPEQSDIPSLSQWSVLNTSLPLTTPFDQHQALGFVPVSLAGADFDHNGFYEGSAWYRRVFQPAEPMPASITLDARHMWAVYLNGHYMVHGQHLLTSPGDSAPLPVTLSQEILAPYWQENHVNLLVVFVDGLGHPKGFHDDAQQAQGILRFDIDEASAWQTLEVCPGLPVAAEALLTLGPPSSPIALPAEGASSGTCPSDPLYPVLTYQTRFTLPVTEGVYAPMGLVFSPHWAIERANIVLNGTLVGRYWAQCQSQNRFYLPPGFLHRGTSPENTNTLALVVMAQSAPPSGKTLISLPSPSVGLEPYGIFRTMEVPVG